MTNIHQGRCSTTGLFELFFIFLFFSSFASSQIVDIDNANTISGIQSAGKINWEQFGPGNAGFGNLLRCHPTRPNRCFVSHDFFNTYGTFDNGVSWTTIKDTDGRGELFRLSDMVFSTRVNSGFGLAIEESRLWRTDVAGDNWQIVRNAPWYVTSGPTADPNNQDFGLDRQSFISKVSAVAIDPANDDVWYVGGGDAPRGQHHLGFNTMTNISAANPTGRNINAIHQGRIWKTSNAGATWTELTNGINPRAQFNRIIVSPVNSNIVFASSNFGLYRSSNGGTSWTEIGTPANGFNYNTFMDMDDYFNPGTGEFVLYALHQVRYFPNGNTTRHEGGIFMSTNNGDSWTNVNGNIELDLNQLADFRVPQSYFRYIARWFGITETQARNTYPVIPTNVLQFFNQIEVDPTNRNTVYVAHHDPQIQRSILPGRLWKTTNRGATWVSVARDNGNGNAWTRDQAYWSSRGNPFNDNMVEGHQISSLQLNNSYPLRATRSFAVNSIGHLMLLYAHNTFISRDGGDNWVQINEERLSVDETGITIIGTGDSNLPGAAIHQDRRLGEGIAYFGSGEHHLWRTSNAADPRGLGRQAITYINGSQESAAAVVTHPFDENIVYVTSERQANLNRVFRSTDGGNTWEDFGRANDAEQQIRTNNLIIDPINPDNIYYGASITEGADNNKQPGVFASSDGGRTFVRRNNGLPNFPQIEDVIFDPRDDTRASLFAAVQYNFSRARGGESGNHEGGLFHSSNRGQTWTRVSIPNQIEGVNRVIFDHANRMYIATGARERAIQSGGLFYSDDFGQTWTQVFTAQYVEHIDISPFDHNRIVVAFGNITRNPGFYLSEDRGVTWTKENNGNGSPNFTRHVEFSIDNEELLYTAIAGSGFSQGIYPGGANARRVTVSPRVADLGIGQTLRLNVSTAFGLNSNNIVYRSLNPRIATINTRGVVTGVARGAVRVLATSNDGRYADFVQLVVGGTVGGSGAISLPGRLEAESFSNQGGIQTENTSDEGGGLNIGFIQNNDFTEYSLNVAAAGTYRLDFRVATATQGGTINIRVNDVNIGSRTVENTTGFQSWETISTAVTLAAGQQTLRLNFTGGAGFLFNINYVDVTLLPDNTAIVPGRVQAESFTLQVGVQTETTSDVGGGQNIGFIQNGDEATYDVFVPDAGNYTFNFRVATATQGGDINIFANNASVGSVAVANTTGFQAWSNVSTTINLNAGLQTIRLTFTGGNGFLFNINHFDIN